MEVGVNIELRRNSNALIAGKASYVLHYIRKRVSCRSWEIIIPSTWEVVKPHLESYDIFGSLCS